MKILNYDSIWNKMADCDIKEQKTNIISHMIHLANSSLYCHHLYCSIFNFSILIFKKNFFYEFLKILIYNKLYNIYL